MSAHPGYTRELRHGCLVTCGCFDNPLVNCLTANRSPICCTEGSVATTLAVATRRTMGGHP